MAEVEAVVQSEAEQSNSALRRLLFVCILVQVIVYGWLLSLGQGTFHQMVLAGDSFEYIAVAQALVEEGRLTASRRTLGYPLFLVPPYALGGNAYGPHLTIAAQLLLNIVFTFLCWRLLERLTPQISVGLRVAATAVFFWAGFGLAINILSDLLAAFLFAIFLYGLLFWRTPQLIFVSALALALATLTRPTFILVPALLPVVAYLVGRVTSRLPATYVAILAVGGLAASGASVLYQYKLSGYLGPSSVVTQNIGRMLAHDDYQEFREIIATHAGRASAGELSGAEEEKYARELFWRRVSTAPQEIVLPLLSTLVKYILVPIEYVVAKYTFFARDYDTYMVSVRPIMFAVFLPLWLLFLVPPITSGSKGIAYYLLTVLLLLYILGISLHTKDQGERMRFPMLAFMLPLILINADALLRRFAPAWLGCGNADKAVDDSSRAVRL